MDNELELHGDLIQSNNVDTYLNLTLKVVSCFEWVKDYCPYAKFVFKTDDDIFINTKLLLEKVDFELLFKPNMSFYGNIMDGSPVYHEDDFKYLDDLNNEDNHQNGDIRIVYCILPEIIVDESSP